MKIKVERTIEKGDLPVMLCWQSLDGRLQIEYYNYPSEALAHYEQLQELDRNPQIWLHCSAEKVTKTESRVK